LTLIPKARCAIFETVSAVIAVLAAAAASVQVAVMRRIASAERTNELFELMHNEHNRKARETVWDLEGKPREQWSDAELSSAFRVAADLSQLGFILRHGNIPRQPFLDIWGRQSIKLYTIIGPMLEDRRQQWDSPERWIYFEWFARLASMDAERRRPWWEKGAWATGVKPLVRGGAGDGNRTRVASLEGNPSA